MTHPGKKALASIKAVTINADIHIALSPQEQHDILAYVRDLENKVTTAHNDALEAAAKEFIKHWDGEPEDAEFYAQHIRDLRKF